MGRKGLVYTVSACRSVEEPDRKLVVKLSQGESEVEVGVPQDPGTRFQAPAWAAFEDIRAKLQVYFKCDFDI